MIDFSQIKLGRKAIKHDSRTLRLENYLDTDLAPAPPAVNWSCGVVDWGMLKNDKLGDCTIAGALHGVMVWAKNLNVPVNFTDAIAVQYYSLWCGYNPSNPDTDQGGILLDIVKDWKAQTLDNFQLSAFASVNPQNIEHVKQAINLFGGLYIGVALPLSAQGQSEWDVVSTLTWFSRLFSGQVKGNTDPGSWGGHCVYVVGYDAETVTVITWGILLKMTWAFWRTYVDEAYALLSPTWVGTKGSPHGLNMTQLNEDLHKIQ